MCTFYILFLPSLSLSIKTIVYVYCVHGGETPSFLLANMEYVFRLLRDPVWLEFADG